MLQLVTAKSLFVKKAVLCRISSNTGYWQIPGLQPRHFTYFSSGLFQIIVSIFGPEYLLIQDMKDLGFYITFKLKISIKVIVSKIKHF